MKTTLDNLNIYLSTRLNSESWESGVLKSSTITGDWLSYGDGFLVSFNGQATSDIIEGNYIYFNKRPFVVLQVVNNNKIKIDKSFEISTVQKIYRLTNEQYLNNLLIDQKHYSALVTAELRVTSGKYWTLPVLWSSNVYFGIYEMAFWLYTTGGNNEAVQDINNGIIKKKIDVLEWQYDKDAQNSIIPASKETIDFLYEYQNSIGTGGGIYDL
jgi:hypothetical protein